MRLTSSRFALTRLLFTFTTLALAACGGGGSGDSPASTPTPPAVPVSMNGTVLGGPTAQVCLDTNKNGSCDTTEPSTTSSAQGSFTLTGVLDTQLPGTAVMATIPASGVSSAYKLEAPAAKASIVSPLTTLVQASVAKGATLAEAEQAAAAQLQIGTDELYRNYIDTSASGNRFLAESATTILTQLASSTPPAIAPPADSANEYYVNSLRYFAPTFYSFNYSWIQPPAAGRGPAARFSMEVSRNGSPVYLLDSRSPLWIWTPNNGWVFSAAQSVETTYTPGSPAVAKISNGVSAVSAVVETDVSGQTLLDVVRQVTSAEKNNNNAFLLNIAINATTLPGSMPAGSKLRWHRTRIVDMGAPAYDEKTPSAYSAPTLAALAAAYPVPTKTINELNTAKIGRAHGLAGCPFALYLPDSNTCIQEDVRVAFGPGNTATYYLCDSTYTTGAATNCTAAGTGTFELGTTPDLLTPLMNFAGSPAVIDAESDIRRILIEREGVIHFGLLSGPSTRAYATTQMNRIAFETLAAALKFQAPEVPTVPSVFRGLWNIEYTGTDSGSCRRTVIDALGHLSALCTRPDGSSVTLDGSVQKTGGAATFGSSTIAGGFAGAFNQNSAAGTWGVDTGAHGTWTAVKR